MDRLNRALEVFIGVWLFSLSGTGNLLESFELGHDIKHDLHFNSVTLTAVWRFD